MKLLKFITIIIVCTTIQIICMQPKKTVNLPLQTETPQSDNPFDILKTKSFDNFSLSTSKYSYKRIYNFLVALKTGQRIYEEVPKEYWDAYQVMIREVHTNIETLKNDYGTDTVQRLIAMANMYAKVYKKPILNF